MKIAEEDFHPPPHLNSKIKDEKLKEKTQQFLILNHIIIVH